jgi:RNA recognition motif-containing protein
LRYGGIGPVAFEIVDFFFLRKRENFPFVVSSQDNIFRCVAVHNNEQQSPLPRVLKMTATGNTQTEGQTDSATTANTNRVWVGNLAYKSSEQDLRDAFAGMKM